MISTKTVRVFKLHSWKKQHIVTVTSVPNSRGKSPPFCDHEATSDISGCPQLDSEQEKSTEPCLEGYYTEDSDRFPSEEHRERTSNSIYKMQEEKLQLDLRGNNFPVPSVYVLDQLHWDTMGSPRSEIFWIQLKKVPSNPIQFRVGPALRRKLD